VGHYTPNIAVRYFFGILDLMTLPYFLGAKVTDNKTPLVATNPDDVSKHWHKN